MLVRLKRLREVKATKQCCSNFSTYCNSVIDLYGIYRIYDDVVQSIVQSEMMLCARDSKACDIGACLLLATR